MFEPMYDLSKSFEYNCKHGPFFDGLLPERIIPDRSLWHKVFDYELMTPIGLSASPLGATARSISLASRLGFDLIIHKTIRSHPVPAHPLPNLAYVKKIKDGSFSFIGSDHLCSKKFRSPDGSFDFAQFMAQLSVTNSFGNASMELDWHLDQIAQARSQLLPGQLLAVSVFGTEQDSRSAVQDFAFLAACVADAGAHIVELNLSCPNAQHGILFHDVELSAQIVRASVRAAPSVPVVVKVESFKNTKEASSFMRAITMAGARGISGINTVPATVLNDAGAPYFGSSRAISGVSGASVLPHAQAWLKLVTEVNRQEQLNLTIFAAGGITLPEQFEVFLQGGADVALTATGALWNPYIADLYHRGKLNENAIQSNHKRRVVDSAR